MARNIEQEVDRLAQTIDELRGNFSTLAHRVGDVAHTASSEGRRQFGRVRDVVGSTAGTMASQARGGIETVQEEIEYRPLASVLVAFMLGLLVGKLLNR